MVTSPDLRDAAARQWYLENDPILHPAPGVSIPVSQLTEDQQIEIALRLGLISSLPLFIFDESKREKLTECIICMCDYEFGDELRYLPCLHTYHRACIDDWLMRSTTCPSCLDELHPPCNSSSSLRNRFSSASSSIKSDLANRFNMSLNRRQSSRSRDKYQQSLAKKSSFHVLDYESNRSPSQSLKMKPDAAPSADSTCSSILSSSSGAENTHPSSSAPPTGLIPSVGSTSVIGPSAAPLVDLTSQLVDHQQVSVISPSAPPLVDLTPKLMDHQQVSAHDSARDSPTSNVLSAQTLL